jgi:hypothetical protein
MFLNYYLKTILRFSVDVAMPLAWWCWYGGKLHFIMFVLVGGLL